MMHENDGRHRRPPILKDLKRLQEEEGKTLGVLVSELLATALAQRGKRGRARKAFRWVSHPMQARIDAEDREAVAERGGVPALRLPGGDRPARVRLIVLRAFAHFLNHFTGA